MSDWMPSSKGNGFSKWRNTSGAKSGPVVTRRTKDLYEDALQQIGGEQKFRLSIDQDLQEGLGINLSSIPNQLKHILLAMWAYDRNHPMSGYEHAKFMLPKMDESLKWQVGQLFDHMEVKEV